MEELLDEQDLAKLLKISIFTVRRNRCIAPDRLPPHVKFGSAVRYRLNSVLKWLEDHEVGLVDKKSTETSPRKPVRRRGRPTKYETVRKTKNADR